MNFDASETNLFACAAGETIQAGPCTIATPAGEITSYLTAMGLDTRTDQPADCRALENGGRWYCWRSANYRAELILTPYDPDFHPESAYYVEGCEAAIWRVRAETELLSPAFACGWRTLPSGATGGPDYGQYYFCWHWDIGALAVNISATEGEEMSHRAEAGDIFIPKRLLPELHGNTGGLVYNGTPIGFDSMERFYPDGPMDKNLVNGLLMPFSSLENGEVLQIDFMVAWTHPKDDEDASTWYAASVPGPYLLKKMGCWT